MQAQPLITVTSIPNSAAFYCTLLGAQTGNVNPGYRQILIGNEMIMQLHSFDADENHAALGDASKPLGNGVVLWFETDDFDAVLARIEEHNLPLDREPSENTFARQIECWLHDPDGYQVVIAGPSPYPRQPLKIEGNHA